jgi:hypothetical protein
METQDHIDHQRWLIDNGFINDLHKDNLYMYGTIVHRDVRAVEVHINVETKDIDYEIFVDAKLMKKIEKFKKLSTSKGILDLWLLRRLLLKEGNLNFEAILKNFVKTYLGPKWNVKMVLKDIKTYEEGYEQASANSIVNQPINPG